MSSSYAMKSMGAKAFNHGASSDAEAEYDRLRSLAHQEAAKRSSCFDRAHAAYEAGDGAKAHDLSTEGKKHAAKMDEYNRQASEYIFRENNAEGRVGSDEIDLHGQYVEEAERILEERINYARANGQGRLHVIVGKGNHSRDHVQKIKPKVEEVCRQLGLRYGTEENEGRMWIDLQGGGGGGGGAEVGYQQPVYQQPQHGGQHGGQQHHGQGGYQPQQPQQGGGYQQGGQQQQQNNDNEELEKLAKKFLPKIIRKLEGCCTVM